MLLQLLVVTDCGGFAVHLLQGFQLTVLPLAPLTEISLNLQGTDDTGPVKL